MEYKSKEEAAASVNGVEIPIQCIRQRMKHKDYFDGFHHHQYIELLYGLDCDAEVWCNGKCYPLQTGDLVIVNSRKTHTVRSVTRESTYLVIKFSPQLVYTADQAVFEMKYLLPFLSDGEEYRPVFPAEELCHTDVPAHMYAMLHEWEDKEYGYEIALRAHLISLTLWLVRHWQRETGSSLSSESGEAIQALQKGLSYASKNYRTATAGEAARCCCLSYSYFSRLFRRVMGVTFIEYLNHLRLEEAQRLLITTDMNVTRVAMEVGFSTTSYFIVCFKRELHCTPGEFREKHHIKKEQKGEQA